MIFDIDKRQSGWHIDVRQYQGETRRSTRVMEQETPKMYRAMPGDLAINLPASDLPVSDLRDRSHRVALAQARATIDARGTVDASAPGKSGILAGLRAAFARGSAVAADPCSCPA
jgi:hypothetical protein